MIKISFRYRSHFFFGEIGRWCRRSTTTIVASKANSKTMGRMLMGNILHDAELWTVYAGIYWVDH